MLLKSIVSFVCTLTYLMAPVYTINQPDAQTLTTNSPTLWKYQCIDTMKDSRDEARTWKNRKDVDLLIDEQVKIISDIGANCIGIATPYDEEFMPYLKKWVEHARKYKLAVWFRGNFASWEGWFDYPKGMTIEQHIANTRTFILTHPELFMDGDIFTGIPEGENGGPIKVLGSHNPGEYRELLKKEYSVANQAFASIHKKVVTNWFSMSGGWATSVLDTKTINSIGHTVVLDHYVARLEDMMYFINEFHNRGAKIVLGEFGAPIPDLNGNMTEDQQADFIKEQMNAFYLYKNNIVGINYWTLKHSSTAILNNDNRPRKVVEVLKDFYQPGIIEGTVKDQFNRPIKNITLRTNDGINTVKTNDKGEYSMVLPAGHHVIVINDDNYQGHNKIMTVERRSKIIENITLTQTKLDFISWLLSLLTKYIHL